MCRGSDHKLGKRRCKLSEPQRQAANARKRQKYAKMKGGLTHGNSNREGEDRILETPGVAGGLVAGREGQDRSNVDGRGHRDGGSVEPRVTAKGGLVDFIGVHKPSEEDALRHEALGRSSVELYELEPNSGAPLFHRQISKLKQGYNKYHASVYVYEQDEYKDMRLFMSNDGCSGIALKSDGDIVSVFSLATAKHKGAAYSMISTMVKLGGKKLDCFDTVLPKIYAQEGFVEVGRDKWSDEYKPEGWDYSTYESYNNGRPDVVYMEYRGLDKAGK